MATLDAVAMRRRRPAQQFGFEIADAGIGVDVDSCEVRLEPIEAGCMRSQPVPVEQALLHDDGCDGRQAPGVRARAEAEMEVGELGGLGPAWVQHDQRTSRIAGDLLQRDAGVGDAV